MELEEIEEKQHEPRQAFYEFYDIHEKYFKKLQETMKQDAEEVISLLETDPREADERFSKSIRQLWACFEKSDNKRVLEDEGLRLPYWEAFNELGGENRDKSKFIGPTRPKFSGWLVEIYVYYFIKKLLEREGLDERLQVLNSKRINIDNLKFNPDIIIKDNRSEKVLIEVKTFVMSEDQVKSISRVYEKCSERDIKFYLFCCEISKKHLEEVKRKLNIQNLKPAKKKYIGEIENLENSEEWVYLPYLGRLKRIVDGIIQPLKET